MPRTAAKITQADIARVLRAAISTGVGCMRVKVTPDGDIIVEPIEDFAAPPQYRGEIKL